MRRSDYLRTRQHRQDVLTTILGHDEVPERPCRAHTFEPTNKPGKFELGGSEEALPEDAGLYPEQGV